MEITETERIKFESRYIPVTESGCWLWLAGCTSGGYGAIRISGLQTGAHRVAYELYRGTIPEELCIDHLCRVRCCVNPWHMETVTLGENAIRGSDHHLITHCPRGHPYSGHNLYLTKGGKERECRICRNMLLRIRRGSNGAYLSQSQGRD